jgi:hypothetical protein
VQIPFALIHSLSFDQRLSHATEYSVINTLQEDYGAVDEGQQVGAIEHTFRGDRAPA